MDGLVESLRRDRVRLWIALVGLVLAELVVRGLSVRGAQLPISVLVIPVLYLALVAEGPATAVAGTGAAAAAVSEYLVGGYAAADLRLRLATVLLICGVAVTVAIARTRRENALRNQSRRLEIAAGRAEVEVILQVMVERLPELTAAGDVVTASQRACVLARDLFGADAVSYWHCEGDEVVLWARVSRR